MNIDSLIPVYDEKRRFTPPALFDEMINIVLCWIRELI